MNSKVSDAFLIRACSNNDLIEVEKALKNEANPNFQDKFGLTPLMIAVKNKNYAIVKSLINAGADIRTRTSDGMYPMAIAGMFDDTDFIDILGEYCWETQAPNGIGLSALHYALMSMRYKSAQHFISHGAFVDEKDENQISLLMKSAVMGERKSTEFLLENGACWHLVDNKYLNVFDYARRANQDHLYELLIKYARSQPIICKNGKVRSILTRNSLSTKQLKEIKKDEVFILQSNRNKNLISNIYARIKSYLNIEMIDIRESFFWSKSINSKRVHKTQQLISYLEDGNIHLACYFFNRNRRDIIIDARNHIGTPLIVLLAKSIGLKDNSSDDDKSLLENKDRIDIAEELFRELIKYKANTSLYCPINGANFAHELFKIGHHKIFFKLYDSGIIKKPILNLSTSQCDRLLHLATRKLSEEQVTGLLKRGADRNPVNLMGSTPIQMCANLGYPELGAVLVHAGANILIKTRAGQSLETIAKNQVTRANTFIAMIEAGRSISKLQNIFSSNNPIAMAARNQKK